MAANPHTGKARTTTQLDALAQKLARAGNFSKSCQALCSVSTPSLGPHTLAKLQAKNSQGSVVFDKTFWPSAVDMDVLRQEDDWWRVAEEHFSVDNIRKYFARSPPLSAQDADGWRPRENLAFWFSEDNEEFHNLIRKHMVISFVLNDFYPRHSEEVDGSKYFVLVKPNANGAPIPNAGGTSVDADVRAIVIDSTWRCCSASRAVAESSLVVVDYLLCQYHNFLQFTGQKDGATRCAQIVQLLLTNHIDHDVSDPLVAVQLDASNAFCSVSRQPQFDVLAGNLMFWLIRHPVPMTMVGYRLATNSLDRAP